MNDEFMDAGRVMELLAVVVLTAYFPILTFSFFKFRLTRKKQELESLLHRLHLDTDDQLIEEQVSKEFSPSDYYMPMMFVTVITALGMVVLFASWVIYGLPGASENDMYKSVLFSGSDFWNTPDYPIEKRNVAVMGFSIIGSFIAGANYIYRRFATIDLTPGNFFSVGMRMVLSMIVALLYAFLTNDVGFESGNHVLAVAFLIGLFPERGLTLIINKVKGFRNKDESKHNRPLETIEGISEMHKLRLAELGIDNVQNLANFNFFLLVIKSPFPTRMLLDWIAQAKLMMEFRLDYPQLQQAGIRSVIDFIDAVKCGHEQSSRDNEHKRLTDIANATGLPFMSLEVNYYNFIADRSVTMLLHIRANLEPLIVIK